MYMLGRKAIKTDSRTLKLAKYLTPELPAPPSACDWTKGITSWGMMKNDVLGDCTVAACGHAIQLWSVNTGTEITVSDDDIVKIYSAWDGYNPNDPSTDQGGVELDVLNAWRKQGLIGHKLRAFTSVNHVNQYEVKTAIYLFGGVYIGVALPISAQNQDIWDVVKDDGSGNATPGSWGGHAIHIVAYDNSGLTCITWGGLKKMTWNFWATYCDESYALFGQDWLTADGKSPVGFLENQLDADLAAIK